MRTSPLAIVGLIAGAWLVATPAAQIFRSTTELVNVAATVVDKDGRAVTGLGKEDFALSEDGKAQDIAFLRFDSDTPVSLALVVDTSGSMVDKMDDVQDALRHFIERLRPDDDVFLLRFNDGVELVAEPDDRGQLVRRLERLYPGGGTALFDGAAEGASVVQRGRHPKRVVVVVTDGNDTDSRMSRKDAVNAITRSETLLYAVGVGHSERGSFGHVSIGPFRLGHGGAQFDDRVDAGTLKDLADPTGGRSYVLEQAHKGGQDLIGDAVQEIARELREQYTIGYYPTNTERDGKFRRISLETRDRSLKVRARRGYWATRNDASRG